MLLLPVVSVVINLLIALVVSLVRIPSTAFTTNSLFRKIFSTRIPFGDAATDLLFYCVLFLGV